MSHIFHISFSDKYSEEAEFFRGVKNRGEFVAQAIREAMMKNPEMLKKKKQEYTRALIELESQIPLAEQAAALMQNKVNGGITVEKFHHFLKLDKPPEDRLERFLYYAVRRRDVGEPDSSSFREWCDGHKWELRKLGFKNFDDFSEKMCECAKATKGAK